MPGLQRQAQGALPESFSNTGTLVVTFMGSRSAADACMSDPIELGQADIEKPFVYDRRYGFFYVPAGMHQQAMSLLLAFHHGLHSSVEVAKALKLRSSHETADHWLEHVAGTAFRSSQSKKVMAGRRGNLNALEIRRLGVVDYLLSDIS